MSDFGTDGNFDTTQNSAIERAFYGAFDGARATQQTSSMVSTWNC